ncbi:MAG TPA: hypothetical protein ENK23_04905 [Sorangium sp.]|nr:hypothetical protein [Sorangium sp.]
MGGSRESWAELYDSNISKLSLAQEALPMIRQHAWFGVGRGAFESTFTAYRYGYDNRVFAHAENWLTQWVAEWGVPVTVVAVLALAWQLRPSRMALRRELGLAVYVGVLVLLVHNLVDLGLEIAAVCVAMSALLGSLHGAARRHGDEGKAKRRAHRRVPSRVSHWGYAGALAALAVMVLLWGRAGVADERRALAASYRHFAGRLDDGANAGDANELVALRAALREAMLRHPAEPYFPLLGATLAWRLKDQDPLPWIQRSLERGLGNGRTHLLLAQILSQRGAFAQARMELRMAMSYSPELGPDAAAIALRSARDITELKETVPAGEPGVRMLNMLALALRTKKDSRSVALRAACDEAALAYDNRLVAPHVRLANDDIDALRARRAPCISPDDRAKCEQRVMQHIVALQRAAPQQSYADQTRARLLLASGELEQADALLKKRCEEVTDRKPCLLERARLASGGNRDTFIAAVKALTAAGCGSYSECAATHSWIGKQYQQREDWPAALRHFMKAAQVQRNPQHWLAVATAASKAGLHGQAVTALERVLRDRDYRDDETLRKRLANERSLLAGSLSGTP